VWYLLVTDTIQAYTIRRICLSPFKPQRRTVSALFSSVVTLGTEKLPEQTHVVRSLISEDSSIVNSVDIVSRVTDPDIAPHSIRAPQDGRTGLHWAAFSGALDITQYLLEQKAEVDKIDATGWTALHIAGTPFVITIWSVPNDPVLVSAGNEDVARELVGAGADVKKPNDKGITPL